MRFTKDHEWVVLEGDVATVGITAHAAEQLGDVVFVETPDVGKTVKAGDAFAVVESANADLSAAPETVNASAEGAGWFAKLRVSNPAEYEALMDRAAYEAFLATQ